MQWMALHDRASRVFGTPRPPLPPALEQNLQEVVSMSNQSGYADQAQSKQDYLYCNGIINDVQEFIKRTST